MKVEIRDTRYETGESRYEVRDRRREMMTMSSSGRAGVQR